jgi:two-component system invasion response regulator UvrY
MFRVLLVDDHRLVRHGIKKLLVEQLDADVGEAESVEEARAAISGAAWDIVIVDITLGGRSGLELLAELHETRPALPVVVLSMHPARQFARRAFSSGARAYLSKNSAPAELVNAITRVRLGQKHISTGAQQALLESPQPHDLLSDREYQVLRMIGAGRTVSQIATDIGLSVKTVSTYRSRLLDKLALTTNAELIRYALREGLVD